MYDVPVGLHTGCDSIFPAGVPDLLASVVAGAILYHDMLHQLSEVVIIVVDIKIPSTFACCAVQGRGRHRFPMGTIGCIPPAMDGYWKKITALSVSMTQTQNSGSRGEHPFRKVAVGSTGPCTPQTWVGMSYDSLLMRPSVSDFPPSHDLIIRVRGHKTIPSSSSSLVRLALALLHLPSIVSRCRRRTMGPWKTRIQSTFPR